MPRAGLNRAAVVGAAAVLADLAAAVLPGYLPEAPSSSSPRT